ncbi:threonine--tRNA ligase [Jiangella sp. DSM 45060]|uniref:threonine--tRNA ligase n=1 Tax=Jiangella sp. DSM 45060 TaxID=1798224 RepID=UPI00087AA711|nr:threonine--tRNA ligase [Jiangella sp. DSM 45060]SDS77126.1 threonyl-tRNA synthetase [Jiangella sp. DSM 45060]
MPDHRKLGRELELFGSDPLIGAGLPYWLPAGAAVRHALEEYVHAIERRAGYQHVHSPALGKRELYELSGHWSHYRDDMFPPMPVGGEELVLRPSLCPHHALIYRSRGRSYRELPLRLAELGGMYRSEPSGVLGGMTRVRSIQLNDAHVFCPVSSAAEEAAAALALIRSAHAAMGIEPVRVRLSLPDAGGKYAGAPPDWERSAALLVEALSAAGLSHEAEEGEAAFYGPKVDVQIADAAGRESTLSTVQIDFHQPARFDLGYVGADGGRHRPVMVHRSIIGSLERAVAQLIEVHGGAFPPWLAPVQVVLVPVGPEQDAFARGLAARCLDAGLRVSVAGADEGSVGARIHAARLAPYVVVAGAREVAADAVALRLRDGRQLEPMPSAEAVSRLSARASAYVPDLW